MAETCAQKGQRMKSFLNCMCVWDQELLIQYYVGCGLLYVLSIMLEVYLLRLS